MPTRQKQRNHARAKKSALTLNVTAETHETTPNETVLNVSNSTVETAEVQNARWSNLSEFVRRPASRLCLLLILHTLLFAAIFVISYSARYDFAMPAKAWAMMIATMPYVLLTKIIVFYVSSHFHGWWRYVTFVDIKSLLRASLSAMVAVAFVDYFFINFVGQIPRSVIVIDALLTIIVIGGLRCTWRFADEQFGTTFKQRQSEPALLIGTDCRTGVLASQINSNPAMPFRIKGLVSTYPNPRKRIIAGISIVGSYEHIDAIATKYNAKHILVPCDALSGTDIRELIKKCNRSGLIVRVLPRFEDALAGTTQLPLREVNIEDLLKRDPVQLDKERLVNFIENKRVLVTGAGGSIGSEICRQLMEFSPKEIVLLGRGENRIYKINRDLQVQAALRQVELHPTISDITNEQAMKQVFEEYRPEIVFHAAAHKHVPLMELHVREALRNNVVGTDIVSSLAHQFGCSHFVMVSTDKAVNPTSVMGATKNIAERVVHSKSQKSDTKFCVVRFGNVLGSAGSVVPLFQSQIRAGGPITVTDARMTRYFMSIPEASQLVLQAGSMARGGEIYVLDMGEPIRIMQLAEDLVELSGLKPGSIEIEITGIREGEKLYEELYFDNEETLPTDHEKVKAAYHRPYNESSESIVGRITDALPLENEKLRALIMDMVPEYAEHVQAGAEEVVSP